MGQYRGASNIDRAYMLDMAFEAFFLTIKRSLRRPNSTFNSTSGDTPRLPRPPCRDRATIICADSFYFRFGFSPVENICFRLELIFFKHS